MNLFPHDDDYDPDFYAAIQADQRRVYAGDKLHACPDCGAENALTAEMKRRGYHCDRCTKLAEE